MCVVVGSDLFDLLKLLLCLCCVVCVLCVVVFCFFFFQAEDGIRDLVRSRGLGDVYKRQVLPFRPAAGHPARLSVTS